MLNGFDGRQLDVYQAIILLKMAVIISGDAP